MIEFDVETKHLAWYRDAGAGLHTTSFHDDTGTAVVRVGHSELSEGAPEALPALAQHALKRDGEFRAWNTKFDLHCLEGAGYELPPPETWHDGMVLAHIMEERTSVALQARGDRLFGAEEAGAATEKAKDEWLATEDRRRRKVSKDTGEEFQRATYADVPWEIMEPYSAHDVELTRRICDVYEPQVTPESELGQLYDLEMDVLRGLYAAENRGIYMDRDALVALEGSLLPDLDEREAHCVAIAEFDNFNPRSPKQISEALDRLGADTRYMTRDAKTKQLVTDEENLAACDHPLADAILGYRGAHKLWAMVRGIVHGPQGKDADKFPHPYLGEDDYIHPNFRQVGARTGRMSCANPNFQQIHRDDLRLRYAVQASPGNKLVCCDLDAIELVLLAMFAGEGAMLRMLKSGEDPHKHTAAMMGLTGRTRSTGAVESARDQGKRANYMVVYGGGLRAMRKWFGMPMDEARRAQGRFYDAYPEIRDLQTRLEWKLEDRGYLKSPVTGRRWRTWNAQRESYKFLNYLIQGTAADILKVAVRRCHDAGVPIVAPVHDELIADVPAGDAEEAARIMQHAMTDFPDLTEDRLPIQAEPQIVDRWSEAKNANYRPDYLEAA